MAKEFVINTGRVNSYGTRVLTSGIDTEQFKRNPVLLYMHRRDRWGDEGTMVIGRVENLRVDGDWLIGTPVFDTADEFAAKVARKWDEDFLRMCSAGIDIIEISASPEHLLPGQIRETVTKSKLVEVSIVDIGANDDALKLYEPGGKVLELAAGAPSKLLPLLEAVPGTPNNDNNKTNFSMEKIFSTLGLAATATLEDALGAIAKLQDAAGRVEAIELARVESAVDAAIEAKKLTGDKRDKFIALGKAAGFDGLQTALDALTPAVKPTQLISPGSGSAGKKDTAELTYSKMSEEMLAELKANDLDEFKRLFKAEFGIEPEIE